MQVSDAALALRGVDAVVSTLRAPGLGPTTVHADGARSVVTAMMNSPVRRLLVISSSLLFDDVDVLGRLLRGLVLRNVVADSREMERTIENSPLDWTVVRAPRLLSGPGKGAYRIERGKLPQGGAFIDRADLADVLLDEVERRAHPRAIVGVSG